MTPRIDHASVPDLVFAQLCDAILSGRYAPGERLPTQRDLAGELQVNLSSVREALGRLEQLRLVEVRHGEATRVLDWQRAGGLEALTLLSSVEPSLSADVFEARRLLLVESARLAAERRTPVQAEQLAELAAAVAAAVDDDTALLADWHFMETLVEASGNLVFRLIMNTVRRLYLPNAEAFRPVVADRLRLVGRYRRAAAAVAAGDGARAARAVADLVAAQERGLR